MQTHKIDYLPGAAELGDFDATSTSIALSPVGEQQMLPPDALIATFERYWKDFAARRTDTPGMRTRRTSCAISARSSGCGWRDRGMELLEFFMNDRRPPEWNQWAEVVGREPRKSRFIGDMPHGWVASDYGRSLLDMFAYERPADETLVLMAGVPKRWTAEGRLRGEESAHALWALSYSLRIEDKTGVLEIGEIEAAAGRHRGQLAGEAAAGTADRSGRGHARWIGTELRISDAAVHDRVSARSEGSMSGGLVERRTVRRDRLREYNCALALGVRSCVCVVDVHDAEALRIAERPFEIVEQRPGEVAAHVGALADRVVHGAQMLAQVVDAQRILQQRRLRPAADRRTPRRSR